MKASRFASSSCGGPLVASRPALFAAHAHRKHFKSGIFENTLIYSGNQTNAIIFQCCISMLCNNFPIGLQSTLLPQNKAFSQKNGLGRPQNDLGGYWDQAYHFQHQKLPLYAQSREPFHAGHGRPFRTNTQANKCLFALLV